MIFELVPDYSHWDAPIHLEGLPLKQITRVLIKATDGIALVDPAFYASAENAILNGVEWGAYHWYKPAYDALTQARLLVKTARFKGYNPPDGYTVDVEEIPPAGSASANLLTLLLEIERLTGIRPIIYTRASFWKLYYYNAFAWAFYYPLHVAHYKDSSGPLVCSPWTPLTFYRWQYTDRENGKFYGSNALMVDMSLSLPRFQIAREPASIDTVVRIASQSWQPPKRKFGVLELLREARAELSYNHRKD